MIASGINIGRNRGEFERATKTMRSVTNGHRDPLVAGVCEISRLADLAARASTKFCSQDKNGRLAKGVPDERWLQANPIAPGYAAGFTGVELNAEHLQVFFCETQDTTMRGGHVAIKRGDRVLAWCEPELFAELGQGYRLTIRFDPSEPTLGAAIFNREVGTRNRHAFSLGQFLGIAEYAPEAPQIVCGQGLLTDEEEAARGHKKRFTSAVRTEYRAIGVFGKRKTSVSSARDGRGNVVTISNTPTGDQEHKPDRVETTLRDSTLAARGSHLSPADGLLPRGVSSIDAGLSPGCRGSNSRKRKDVDADAMSADCDALEAKLRASGDLITM